MKGLPSINWIGQKCLKDTNYPKITDMTPIKYTREKREEFDDVNNKDGRRDKYYYYER